MNDGNVVRIVPQGKAETEDGREMAYYGLRADQAKEMAAHFDEFLAKWGVEAILAGDVPEEEMEKNKVSTQELWDKFERDNGFKQR